MRRLNCPVQKYAWGKRGRDSKVAQLKSNDNAAFEVDEEECFAELWMGTHPNGPSRVAPEPGDDIGSGIFLVELLEDNPHYLGDLIHEGDLPFLFKVLSINKALSIQAHPDKATAGRIYAARPDLYKDDNHKPEMAVALSSFEGLCGFRPFHEIVYNLHRYPELRSLVSLSAVKAMLDNPAGEAAQMHALRKLFTSYITCKTSVVSTQISALVARLRTRANAKVACGERTGSDCRRRVRVGGPVRGSGSSSDGSSDGGVTSASSSDDEGGAAYDSDASMGTDTAVTDEEENGSDWREEIFGPDFTADKHAEAMLRRMKREEPLVEALMLRLSEEYPGDIGIVCPLLLNYLRMGPGEAFFMAANEPHAYLRGDLLEVMARSDNVVRVALTPKYRDVPLLLEILTYQMGAPPLVPAVSVDACRRRYSPPIADFELEDVSVAAGARYGLPALPVPQLAICLSGTGVANDGERSCRLCPGTTFFVPAGAAITFDADTQQVGAGGHGGFGGTEEEDTSTLRVTLSHPNLHYVPPGPITRSKSIPLPPHIARRQQSM